MEYVYKLVPIVQQIAKLWTVKSKIIVLMLPQVCLEGKVYGMYIDVTRNNLLERKISIVCV